MVGGWLFLLLNSKNCCILLLVAFAENGMKERKKERQRDDWSYEDSTFLLRKFAIKSWRGKTSLSKNCCLPSRGLSFLPRVSFWRQEAFFSENAQIVLPVRGFQGDYYFFCIDFMSLFFKNLVLFYYLLLVLLFIIQCPHSHHQAAWSNTSYKTSTLRILCLIQK